MPKTIVSLRKNFDLKWYDSKRQIATGARNMASAALRQGGVKRYPYPRCFPFKLSRVAGVSEAECGVPSTRAFRVLG
jgi:hypothetical protein